MRPGRAVAAAGAAAWHCPNPGKLIKARAKKHQLGIPIPDAAGDTLRLNMLEHAGGFVRGSDSGKASFRVLGYSSWHATLRNAIDAISRDKDSAN